MATRITCPGCGRLLSLPDDCTARLLSCPRCLAQIENPQASGWSSTAQGETPPPAAVTPSRPAPWTRIQRVADVDVEVQRDNRGTSALTILLSILGGLGIAYALLGGFAMLLEGFYQAMLVVLGVLTVLAFFIAGWATSRNPSDTPSAYLGRTLLGVLKISGIIVGVGTLLVFSAVILLFVVCVANGGKC